MANKLAALLVIFLVIAAAVQLPTARAEDDDSDNSKNNNEDTKGSEDTNSNTNDDTKTQGVYLPCLKECIKDCEAKQGRTLCEMKCDTDCFNKAVQAKLKNLH